MTAPKHSHHVRRLVLRAAALVVVAGGWAVATATEPWAGPAEPQLVLTCEIDACVATVDYVLAASRDRHDLTFSWRTAPAMGFPDNAGDVVVRTWPAGSGHASPPAEGFRYRASDLIWHSDIRCDDTVTVRVSGDGITPMTATMTKPVPDSPHGAYCSAHGIDGQRTAPGAASHDASHGGSPR